MLCHEKQPSSVPQLMGNVVAPHSEVKLTIHSYPPSPNQNQQQDRMTTTVIVFFFPEGFTRDGL